eukprot:850003-Pyramimonas_sp.AAC.1
MPRSDAPRCSAGALPRTCGGRHQRGWPESKVPNEPQDHSRGGCRLASGRNRRGLPGSGPG